MVQIERNVIMCTYRPYVNVWSVWWGFNQVRIIDLFIPFKLCIFMKAKTYPHTHHEMSRTKERIAIKISTNQQSFIL